MVMGVFFTFTLFLLDAGVDFAIGGGICERFTGGYAIVCCAGGGERIKYLFLVIKESESKRYTLLNVFLS